MQVEINKHKLEILQQQETW